MKNSILITSIMLIIMNISAIARNYEIYDAKTGESLTMQQFAERSKNFDVMFFGEFHDDSLLHSIQAEYLAALLKLNPKTAVSFEMFERDVQNDINDYLANKIDEKEFLKKSRPWPDYLKFYKPLLELAKEKKLPVIAANIPRKYAALYAQQGMTGINALPSKERKFITKDMHIKDDEYAQRFFKTMMLNMGVDTNTVLTANQENTLYLYYGAQTIKDETMAESIADFLKTHKGWKVIHFNGDFHSNDYLGTVEKLRDRMPDLNIAIITPDYKKKDKPFKFTANFINKTNFLIQLPPFEREAFDMAMMGGHLGENMIVNHDIKIDINTDKRSLKGYDKVQFNNPIVRSAKLTLLKDLKITSITSPDGEVEYDIKPDKESPDYNDIIIRNKGKEIFNLKFEYEGVVYNSPTKLTLNERHSNSVGIISGKEGEGIYLPGGSYYPVSESDMADFSINITVPKDITIITSGKIESLKEELDKRTYHYVSELKTDNFTLVGGHYIEKTKMHDSVEFKSYTFSDNPLADQYLDACINYYDIYSKLLGPYPYSTFSIVENFFATGFGMPGYTLLSNRLMALPWVVLSPGSLAHEFVHNWWGNSVYTSYDKGNWCEALTTFSANYYYNVATDNENNALDWREKALISLDALPADKNYPVADFKYQSNRYDAVIGYEKGAFILYEIMKLMGKDSFFKGLQTFAKKYKGMRASWFSLRYVLNGQAKKDKIPYNISKIMEQWLNSDKIPTLTLDYMSYDGDSLRFNINQFGTSFTSVVPVVITTEKGSETVNYTITKEKNRFSYKPKAELKSIEIDKNYQVLRKLYKWEIPYSFNRTLNSKPLVILPSKKSKDYKAALQIAQMMKQSGFEVEYLSEEDIKSDWSDKNLIVIGNEKTNPFFKNLKGILPEGININGDNVTIDGKTFAMDDNLMLLNMGHPKNEDLTATVITYGSMNDVKPLKRLFHYTSYSMLLLNKDKAGRPLSTKEIFPIVIDKKATTYKFMKMYR